MHETIFLEMNYTTLAQSCRDPYLHPTAGPVECRRDSNHLNNPGSTHAARHGGGVIIWPQTPNPTQPDKGE